MDNNNFTTTFDKIKCKHEEAFHLIDNAIRQEEEDHPRHALNLYKMAIDAIDETLAIPVRVPDNMDEMRPQWDEACRLIHKIKRARAELLQRIGVLSEKQEEAVDSAAASNGSNGAAAAPESRPRTYFELAQALREMKCTGEGIESLELLYSCEHVKLYNIKPNGIVTTALEDSILRIVRMDKDEKKLLDATFFIQIIKSSEAVRIQHIETPSAPSHEEASEAAGPAHDLPAPAGWKIENAETYTSKCDNSWIYPLVPGVSPCYRTEFGAFILPDLEATEPGTSFGIVIPKETGADQIVLEILEGILHGVVLQPGKEAGVPEGDLSARVSSRIIRGASFVSQNIVRGAEKAGELMTYSTPYLISKIRPAPEGQAPVSENVKTSVEVAKNVSSAAAGITGYIAGKVGSATMALGRFLAPHIQNQGSQLLSKGFGIDEATAQQKVDIETKK